MDTRRIGSLDVSVVGLGCNNFGGRLGEEATAAVVHAALDSEITLFDTADIYGNALSEEYLGKALGKHRADIVLATKFGIPYADQPGGASPEYIAVAVDNSLRRLGTDWIDLYQLHAPDPKTPIADTLGALDALVTAGKVRQIGCSNFNVEQLTEAAAAAKGAAFVSVQNQYNVLHREPEDGVLEYCAEHGLAFLPFFPLASGLLSGKYEAGTPAPEGTRLAALPAERAAEVLSDEALATVRALSETARAHGHSVLELAIAWLLAHPPVASVIAGATKPEQVRANVAAATWVLDDDLMARVDDIAPRKRS